MFFILLGIAVSIYLLLASLTISNVPLYEVWRHKSGTVIILEYGHSPYHLSTYETIKNEHAFLSAYLWYPCLHLQNFARLHPNSSLPPPPHTTPLPSKHGESSCHALQCGSRSVLRQVWIGAHRNLHLLLKAQYPLSLSYVALLEAPIATLLLQQSLKQLTNTRACYIVYYKIKRYSICRYNRQ